MVAVVTFFCILKNLYSLVRLLQAFQPFFMKIINLFLKTSESLHESWGLEDGFFLETLLMLVASWWYRACFEAATTPPPPPPPPSPLHWRQILKHYTYSMRYIGET